MNSSPRQAAEILLHGGTVITATQRLARHLREAYDRKQAEAGHVWSTARAFSLEAWLSDCWEEALMQGLAPAVTVLTTHQEQALWERAVEACPDPEFAGALLRTDAGAHAAARSYRSALRWGLDPVACRNDPSPDVRAFAAWAAEFQRICTDRNWISAASVPWKLAELGQTLANICPGEIHLLGFDHHDPASQALFHALEEAGVVLHDLDKGEEARALAGDVRRLSVADPVAELEAAAQWAWRLLKAGETGPIGVVIHDLAARRDAVETAFAGLLHPQGLPEDATVRLFNLSQGASLRQEGVIHAALAWLRLGATGLDADAFGSLARSPHIGLDSESSGRALLDLRLRRSGMPRMCLPDAKDGNRFDWPWLPGARDFSNRLKRLSRQRGKAPSRCGTAQWARRFADWLKTAGWPDGRGLHSREFQAVQRFRQLLNEFAALSAQTLEMSAGQAVERLSRMAGETLFQPQSGDAPVQILGLLEAGGLRFEHLWVTGMAEDVWPAAPRPDPFLPLREQRQKGMPHADAATELVFARQVTRRLAGAAPEVVFSHPLRRDEQELAASPLIAGYPQGVAATDAVDTWRSRIAGAGACEAVEDVLGTALATDQREEVRGGTAVLRDQSLCPFRAYARHRLRADEPERPADGPDARQRGHLIHAALQGVWEVLEDSHGLAAMDEGALRVLVDEVVESKIQECVVDHPSAYAGDMAVLERDRVAALVLEWLQLEKGRPPFRVLGTEQERDLRFGPLSLRGMIDRVDGLESGRRVVMDYKTGRVSPAAWLGERPDEPQLPAYALAEEADGLCFAQVRAGEMKLVGLVGQDEPTTGLKTALQGETEPVDWPRRMDRWRDVLDGLAEDFAGGRAEVAPNSRKACEYCELGSFCRVSV